MQRSKQVTHNSQIFCYCFAIKENRLNRLMMMESVNWLTLSIDWNYSISFISRFSNALYHDIINYFPMTCNHNVLNCDSKMATNWLDWKHKDNISEYFWKISGKLHFDCLLMQLPWHGSYCWDYFVMIFLLLEYTSFMQFMQFIQNQYFVFVEEDTETMAVCQLYQ